MFWKLDFYPSSGEEVEGGVSAQIRMLERANPNYCTNLVNQVIEAIRIKSRQREIITKL